MIGAHRCPVGPIAPNGAGEYDLTEKGEQMSNAEDEKLMMSTDWQRKTAQAIASAVDAYFSKRLVAAP